LWYHPKHVEQFQDKINCVTLHLVGHILENSYDAWTHERYTTTVYLDLESPNMCVTGQLHVQTHNDKTAEIFAKVTVTQTVAIYIQRSQRIGVKHNTLLRKSQTQLQVLTPINPLAIYINVHSLNMAETRSFDRDFSNKELCYMSIDLYLCI
jgi:hypothetical protein